MGIARICLKKLSLEFRGQIINSKAKMGQFKTVYKMIQKKIAWKHEKGNISFIHLEYIS